MPELAARGFKDTGSHFPKVGPVVTAGGLIFAGTRDRKVRAMDAQTGKVIWEATLDAALEGMPAVYEVKGREYVVFCAAAQARRIRTIFLASRRCGPPSQAPMSPLPYLRKDRLIPLLLPGIPQIWTTLGRRLVGQIRCFC